MTEGNKVGRPTKYEGEKTVQKVYAIIDRMSQKDAVKEFFSFCGVEQIADALGVHKDTIYEWRAKHPELSDALKMWETKRNALFYNLAISPQVKTATWIFLAKNWLGMTDIQKIEGGESLMKALQVIIPNDGTKKDNSP